MTKHKTSRGFTLIEVMVAMLLLAGAMVALSQSWSGSLFSYRKAQSVSTIVSLLKKKTTELEIKYKALSFTEIPEEETGTFEGGEFADFSWIAETKDLEFPDISQVLISQEGGSNDMLLSIVKQMTDFFSKSTKELRVTVIWKASGREVKYSVVTYLVNNAAGGGVSPAGAGGAAPPGGGI